MLFRSELIWQFTTELKLLVKDCRYADQDEMVRDRIVIGCKTAKVRELLIEQGSDLSLEVSQMQMKTLADEDPKV